MTDDIIKRGISTLKKFDDEGNEIETTEEEREAVAAQMRQAMLMGQIVMPPEVVESLKAKGLTPEQIESWMAEAIGLKQ